MSFSFFTAWHSNIILWLLIQLFQFQQLLKKALLRQTGVQRY
jgi:hypothetical protein